MKFSCDKKSLSEAIAGVSRAVASANSVPILQGILIKASGFRVELTGYDMQMAITTSLTANVMMPGEIVLPSKLLGDMVRGLAGEEIMVEAGEDLNTHITSGITEYDIMGLVAADFPDLPVPGADRVFEMDAAELASMISATIYAVSNDDKRPAHTGELFSVEEGELTIVALDGFRIALNRRPIIADKDISVVVPAKTASEVARLIGAAGGSVQVDASNRFVVFSGGGYTIISRLIEGEFLNYKTTIPKDMRTKAIVDVSSFEKAIERCSIIITERVKNPLRVTFDNGDINIKCQTALGKVSDKLEANITGEKVEIGFNYRYLLDALRNAGCDQVMMEMSGSLSPIKISPPEGDEFLAMVLPVRFLND